MTRSFYYRFIYAVLLIIVSIGTIAQESNGAIQPNNRTQTLRGKITDQVLQKPIAGATVQITATNQSVISDDNGSFKFTNVPVGNHQIVVSSMGFREAVVDNLVVNSGKECVVHIGMEFAINDEQLVEVVAKSRKNRPVNEMSVVSARAFTVEETQKYAAAVNDPLRMATSFAGVVSADDGNNEIVIRGNSPAGLLWRMEGVEIPNPNHFSSAGSSGGGISILSSQLLSNSDFVTGAFSAEYGNALSGVFDLSLRKGNNEKREYTLQAGLLGLNIAAEGPIMPFYKGSYLVNYRYSTLQLLDKIGMSVGTGTTNFQDLSFNIYLPTVNTGDFTIFGFSGISDQNLINETDSSKWESDGDRYGGVFRSNTTAVGITHKINIADRSQLKSVISHSLTRNEFNENYVEQDGSLLNSYRNNYKTGKWTFTTTFNHQFSRRTMARTGFIINRLAYNFYQKSWDNPGEPILERINSKDATATVQAFAQINHRFTERLSVQAGLHYLTLLLNRATAVEPRGSVKFQIDQKNMVAFGYGLHSQLQGLGIYFASISDNDGNRNYGNADLDFTKAHHFVLSYGHAFNRRLKFKSELYYQRLFDVPVSSDITNTFSTLNIRGDYVTEALENSGRGRNYGIEVSLEKNLSNNFYFLLNQSFYQARYTAKDGVERNTRFNGNRASTFTGGKEIIANNGKRIYGINVKLIYAGGFRTTPIDLPASLEKGYTVYEEDRAFTLQNPDYVRADLGLSIKWNRPGLTSTLSLDIQNLTNRQNIYGAYFDARKNKVVTSYQTGFIPVLNFKVEF